MNDLRTRAESWNQTPESFEKFLKWLDDGSDSEGQTYLEMRRRLVAYFDRKNCQIPDELADETLNRVSRRLDEEGSIETDTPAHFCYITARYVFLESLRKAKDSALPLDEAVVSDRESSLNAPEEDVSNEEMLGCLEDCTAKLDEQSREMIYGYYFGKGREKIDNRRGLAEKFGVTVNALSIKACRIRMKLETCVGKCAGIS